MKFENSLLDEVSDLVKNTLSLKSNNDLINFCHRARYTCERLLQIIYMKEVNSLLPKNIGFQTMLDSIVKTNNEAIPLEIRKVIEFIGAIGNQSSHPNQIPEHKRKQDASSVEQFLAHLCNWFFNDYFKFDLQEDIFNYEKTNYKNAQEKNYHDLIVVSLDDGILDLDEYEQILDARDRLQIDHDKALQIEQEVVLNQFRKNIKELSEILNPIDLETFKNKYDIINHKKPEWVKKGIDCLINDNNNALLKGYLKYYFDEIPNDTYSNASFFINLLGCWQGWYFQNNSKTYFDLFFIAYNENQFKGYCIEPLNRDWRRFRNIYDEKYLFAEIDGKINDDLLFEFKKSMLLKDSWSINYEGILIEDGQYFEGEWNIKGLNGSFNAMKSKSLLPLLIVDTLTSKPNIKTQFLNTFLNLTSSWFVQLQGKNAQFGILHIIEIENYEQYNFGLEINMSTEMPLLANLILQENNTLTIDYMEGYFEQPGKAVLISTHSVKGEYLPKKISFSIDWSKRMISGIIKDEIYKMRSFKAYKI